MTIKEKIVAVETEAKAVEAEYVSLFNKVVTAYTATWLYWLPAVAIAAIIGHVI